MRTLSFFVTEAIASLIRSWRSTLLATATIVAATFVLGAIAVMTANAGRALARWSSVAELSVYLADDITLADRRAIEDVLADDDAVARATYVSRGRALERFTEDFPDLAELAQGLGGAPLPASFEVRLATGADEAAVEGLLSDVTRLAGVDDVRYERDLVERLATVALVARSIGLALAAVLIIAAALTVMSVVRLGYLARRDEVRILYLLGAPRSSIKGPFVVEGMIEAGVGTSIALALLAVVFAVVDRQYGDALAGSAGLAGVAFLPLGVSAGIICGGTIIGGLAGWFAAREHGDEGPAAFGTDRSLAPIRARKPIGEVDVDTGPSER